jgi:hypothetical protein
MSSQQLVDDAFAMVAKVNGYLAKLYQYKSNMVNTLDEIALNNGHKLFFLRDPELLKLRGRIEKKFPALPDLQKVPGSDFYMNNAPMIAAELASHYEIFVEVYEILHRIRTILKDFQSMVYEYKVR